MLSYISMQILQRGLYNILEIIGWPNYYRDISNIKCIQHFFTLLKLTLYIYYFPRHFCFQRSIKNANNIQSHFVYPITFLFCFVTTKDALLWYVGRFWLPLGSCCSFSLLKLDNSKSTSLTYPICPKF